MLFCGCGCVVLLALLTVQDNNNDNDNDSQDRVDYQANRQQPAGGVRRRVFLGGGAAVPQTVPAGGGRACGLRGQWQRGSVPRHSSQLRERLHGRDGARRMYRGQFRTAHRGLRSPGGLLFPHARPDGGRRAGPRRGHAVPQRHLHAGRRPAADGRGGQGPLPAGVVPGQAHNHSGATAHGVLRRRELPPAVLGQEPRRLPLSSALCAGEKVRVQ